MPDDSRPADREELPPDLDELSDEAIDRASADTDFNCCLSCKDKQD